MEIKNIYRISMIMVAFCAAGSVFGADPAYYAKKGSWQETIQASREALIEYQHEIRIPKYGSWHQIGPYKEDGDTFNKQFLPEKEINLEKADGKLKWKKINSTDGRNNGVRLDANAVLYFYRTVTVSGPVTVTNYYSCDEGMMVFLNGAKVSSMKDSPRLDANKAGKAVLNLKKGENHLLLKLWNKEKGSGWFFCPTKNYRNYKTPQQVMREGILPLVQRDFKDAASVRQIAWETRDKIWEEDWKKGDFADLAKRYVEPTKGSSLGAKIEELAAKAKSQNDLKSIQKMYALHNTQKDRHAEIKVINLSALRLAIEDLSKTFGRKYPKNFLKDLEGFEKKIEDGKTGDVVAFTEELKAFQKEALLANPLLDFDKLLFIKRKGKANMPQNWVGNCSKRSGFNDEIAVLSPVAPDGKQTTLYKDETGKFVGDVDLHWNADKMLFSSQLENRKYEVFEIKADGTGKRQVSKTIDGVDNYDACYLPSGKIIYDSTSIYQGVPCVGGGSQVANLHVMNDDGTAVRRLCFDQDHDWYPSVMNDGRIMFTRWEYSDTAHYFTRIVMVMNPDGTNQRSYYGSNSLWPNSTFYMRVVPNNRSQFVGIISGHHGVAREGEFILFDTALGNFEADGVVQRIPGYGKKVEPKIADSLVNNSHPRFLHPYPLSSKYHLVSSNRDGEWEIYLVDVFDNMLKLVGEPGYSMLEPVPFRKTKMPPEIPERVDITRKDAVIHMTDIYTGGGLKGVPRGTVKKMRIFAFDYGYHGLANHTYIGIEGPWDVHRILGTVDVEKDGSASFHVPANTPIALQPLDEEGQSIQLMRSWLVAMPGENLSCIGCHEDSKEAPVVRSVMATKKKPQMIKPWYGPARGFSFNREIQPVLDKYCVGCHNGQPDKNGKKPTDLRNAGKQGFSVPYSTLQKHVRRPGPEGDYHMYPPAEYAANTSPLIQMLKKGHYNVKLDREAYERFYTWIDLNVPFYGTWGEFRVIPNEQQAKRADMRKLYAGIDEDYETIPEQSTVAVKPIIPEPVKEAKPDEVKCEGWPINNNEAKKRQGENPDRSLEVDLDGKKLTLDLVRIPAGQFVMGNDHNGAPDEMPVTAVKIDKPFWIAKKIITNADYALFDPKHDSGYLDRPGKDHSNRGTPINGVKQPVVRVSWDRAMDFCDWLSKKTGKKFTLPTEAQWEYVSKVGRIWATDFTGGDVEWTRTTYKPYPYNSNDGRDKGDREGQKVARGGKVSASRSGNSITYRMDYYHWQPVYNVGFRVICLDEEPVPPVAE